MCGIHPDPMPGSSCPPDIECLFHCGCPLVGICMNTNVFTFSEVLPHSSPPTSLLRVFQFCLLKGPDWLVNSLTPADRSFCWVKHSRFSYFLLSLWGNCSIVLWLPLFPIRSQLLVLLFQSPLPFQHLWMLLRFPLSLVFRNYSVVFKAWFSSS